MKRKLAKTLRRIAMKLDPIGPTNIISALGLNEIKDPIPYLLFRPKKGTEEKVFYTLKEHLKDQE